MMNDDEELLYGKFLDNLDKFLSNELGENWSYNFDEENEGLNISMRVWGDLFKEEEEQDDE